MGSRLIKTFKTSFSSGELMPQLRARIDIKHYYNGGERMRNVIVLPQGGVRRRPGLKYLAETTKQLTLIDLSTKTVTTANGGTVGLLYDGGDTASPFTNSATIGTTNPYISFHIDMGSAVAVRFFDVYRLYLTGTNTNPSVSEFKVQYSADNSAWTDFGTFASLGAADSGIFMNSRRRFGGSAAVTARYWRLARIGTTDLGSAVPNILQIRVYTESSTLSNARLLGMSATDDAKYMILLTDLNAAIYKAGVLQANVSHPFTSAQLPAMRWTQSLDTLILFHEDVSTRKIVRNGGDAEWGFGYVTFSNVPNDFVLSSGATVAIINSQSGLGAPTSAVATGWPKCGTFHEGRLYLAGSYEATGSLIASKPGSFFDLDDGTGADTDGFYATIDTDQVSAIFNIYSGRHLSLFTSSAEFYVLPNVEPITADTIVIKRTTEVGSEGPGIPVVSVDGAVLFLQPSGTALREFLFTDSEAAYVSQNISLLSAHLMNGPVDMALRRSAETDEGDMVAVVNGDGTLALLQTLRSQEITAWSLHETNGDFKAVGYQQQFYFVVRRTINGTDEQFLEVWDDAHYMDCSTTGGAASGDSSLSRFEGASIATRADEANLSNETVASGAVTFDTPAVTSYEVGLAFPDVSDDGSGWQVWVKDMPVDVPGLPSGTMRFNKKRVVQIGASLLDTQYASVRANDGSIQALDLSTATPPAQVTGDYEIDGLLGYSDTAQAEIGQTVTGPFTCLGLFKRVAG